MNKQSRLQLQQQRLKQLTHREQGVRITAQYIQATPQLAVHEPGHRVQRRALLDHIAQGGEVRGKAQKGLHRTGGQGGGGRQRGLQFVQQRGVDLIVAVFTHPLVARETEDNFF